MDNKALSEAVTGIFRLRKNHPHMAGSTIVDLQDDDITALTTVEVSEGVVTLSCLSSWEELEAEHIDEHEDEESKDEEEEEKDDDSEDDDEHDDDDKKEDEDDKHPEGNGGAVRSYTVASGNSVTVRAAVIRVEPVGKQTAEGTYRIQIVHSAD
jgi:ABC-type Zn2+ transport system substrate-binding protein/surface adhesin